MKLIIAIVRPDSEDDVITALNAEGYEVTRLSTQGGFLRKGNTTLMTGTDDDRVSRAVAIIKEQCGERQLIRYEVPRHAAGSMSGFSTAPGHIEVGGATIFVLNVEKFEHF